MALFTRRRGSPDEAEPDSRDSETRREAGGAPEARPSRRRTVGQLLRKTRESYGSDVERVAQALRIRASYLEAIEGGSYDRLPGPVYALGFVRAYAVHLGLDGDEAVRRFKLEAEGFDGQRDLAFPVPLAERSIPGGTMLLVALILAICGYGLWYYLSANERPRPERVAEVPAQLAPPVPAATPTPPPEASPSRSAAAAPAPAASAAVPPAPPATPAAPSAAASSDAPMTTGAPASESPARPVALAPPPVPATPAVPEKPTAPPDLTAVLSPPPAPAQPTAPAAPPSVPESVAAPAADSAHVYGLANGETRIVIRAISDSWVQVRDRDHVPLFTRQLHAGDTYHVPDRPGLSMRTGKGAGLAITVDGRQTPPIGGAVRPNVLLDPDRLLAGTAVAD